MQVENPIRSRNEKLLFTAAADDQTLVGGLTVLRIVPGSFETTLRFFKNAHGNQTVTIDALPLEARAKIFSYWTDHLQLPMTDRLEFMIDDIAELARLSAESEQAVTLRFFFRNMADNITPFMPHTGLRLIYDTQPDDPNWGMAELTEEATKPKLGDLALCVDIVPIEVRSERPAHVEERREMFLTQLGQYKNRLATRSYPGASEISPVLMARVIDIDRSLLELDLPEKDDEEIGLSTRLYSVGGGMLDELLGEEEGGESGGEEHQLTHDIEHGAAGAAALHAVEHAGDGAGHAGGAEHAIAEAAQEEQKLAAERAHAHHIGEEAHGRIHQMGSGPLELWQVGQILAAMGQLNAAGLGGEAAALGAFLAAHQAHAREHNEQHKHDEEARHEIDNENRIKANEWQEALQERADQVREETQMRADEWEEETALAAGENIEDMHAEHSEQEEIFREWDEGAEFNERQQDEANEELTLNARELQEDLMRRATETRDEQELSAAEEGVEQEEGGNEAVEAAGEHAAEAGGEAAEFAHEAQVEGGEYNEAVNEAGGERDAELNAEAGESADAAREQMEESMRERRLQLEETARERQLEGLELNREERLEGESRFNEDTDEIQKEAAEGREANARSVEESEKEQERVLKAQEELSEGPEREEHHEELHEEEHPEPGSGESHGSGSEEVGHHDQESGPPVHQHSQALPGHESQGIAHDGIAHQAGPAHAPDMAHAAHGSAATDPLHAADMAHHMEMPGHSGMGGGLSPETAHHAAGRYDALHEAAGGQGPSLHGATSHAQHASLADVPDLKSPMSGSSHSMTDSGVRPQYAALNNPHHAAAVAPAAAPDMGSHIIHGLDALHAFHRASEIQLRAPGHWAALGKTQFSPAHFSTPPGVSFEKFGPVSMASWPGAMQPKFDPVDRLTRSIVDRHYASPHKTVTFKAPNFGHSFTDFYPQASLNPAPAPSGDI